jgi:hypothetical protein
MLQYTNIKAIVAKTNTGTRQMTTKDKLDFIYKYMPGDLGDIAMMVPCHINTIRKIRSGEENIRPIIKNRIDELFVKAEEIKAISES